jgi:hypothetical protein
MVLLQEEGCRSNNSYQTREASHLCRADYTKELQDLPRIARLDTRAIVGGRVACDCDVSRTHTGRGRHTRQEAGADTGNQSTEEARESAYCGTPSDSVTFV